ncbi:MAG: glycosyltransferase family 2 protein [Streptococcaceae bacterium]|jgi:glycosyltransferase involved in cell wall biosynthesis|nr:glycosyltransferase family 2 protein [Streptococcaceae bacterium]
MKKLSIIIPFKGLTEKELTPALSSLNGQIGIDFSTLDLHLINDGGPGIDISKFDILSNLNVTYHELALNVGPGMARQYGIDHSDGEYILFIDSDDELHYTGALLDFYNVLKESGDHQLIIGRYIQQQKNSDGDFRYFVHDESDTKAVYAKMYKRSYLESLGLSFHPKLRLFEDNYFVGLACECASDIYYLKSVVYSWLYNPDSLVRSTANFFSRQTAIVPQAMRYYFEFLQPRFPEKINLEDYVVNMYLRSTRLEPADTVEFWQSHISLMTEFKNKLNSDVKKLQVKVNQACQSDPFWQGTDASGFAAFYRKSVMPL